MLSLEAEKFYFIRVFLFSHDELLDSRKKAVADLTLWSSNIHSLPKFYLQDINVLNDSLHNFFEASSLPSSKNSSDPVPILKKVFWESHPPPNNSSPVLTTLLLD